MSPLTWLSDRAQRRAVKPSLLLAWVSLCALPAFGQTRLTVTHDDTRIRESCDVFIPPGTVIKDSNNNGVLIVEANDIRIRFVEGSRLDGASPGTPWDQMQGIGLRIDNHRGVTLENARIHGFFNGIVATSADGLQIIGSDFSDNYRQHLGSTPSAENGGDWLFPHHNDERKWREEYGGAVCIENSKGVTVRGIRVRRGQNGILLDRVNDSQFFDNDCSFLTGWGIALWRSSANLISRNALDFCVRGHEEGVYNRGQDSAGILCFEQSSRNIFVENSVTHGGDGFFGFAGREALGELWMAEERERLRRETTGKEDVDKLITIPPEVSRRYASLGCNSNILAGNDFSYAAAHGIEMTFSHGNALLTNRIVENAICGIWGGYSSGTLIQGNEISRNGGMAYGLERGGINMEHASENWIVDNAFHDNKCAIHLWWDNDAHVLQMPQVAANDRGVSSNVIARNVITIGVSNLFSQSRSRGPLVVLQLRDEDGTHLQKNAYLQNKVQLGHPSHLEFDIPAGTQLLTNRPLALPPVPKFEAVGSSRPVGARKHLQGRHQIVMDEWGPWDHESPLVRPVPSPPGRAAFDIRGVAKEPIAKVAGKEIKTELVQTSTNRWRLTLIGPRGVNPYEATLGLEGIQRTLTGTLLNLVWETTFFPWTIDPRERMADWLQLANGPDAVRLSLHQIDLQFGSGGPKELKLGEQLTRKGPGPDHFGMIARARFDLPAGRWKFSTLSDDGVRVSVNGTDVINNWSWHGPTTDTGVYDQPANGEATVEVAHFEIDGYAVLRLEIAPQR